MRSKRTTRPSPKTGRSWHPPGFEGRCAPIWPPATSCQRANAETKGSATLLLQMEAKMNANLYEQLVGSVDDVGQTTIEMPDGKQYSYLDLVSLSAGIANVLVARGVKPGDRVAVEIEKSFVALV